MDDLVVGISPDVNRGCLLVAYMKAFDDYTEYLKATMRKAQSAPGIDSDLKWHGDVSDLNEVATVLEGYIMKGNRPATLKEIRQAFGTLLQTNLDNGDQLDYNRRNNENDGPSFLGKLDEKREKRKNNLDDNQRSRKRRL